MSVTDKNEKWTGDVSGTNAPQAKNDGSTTTPFLTVSEDNKAGGLGSVTIKTADLMANDSGGSAKNFYAVVYDASNDAKASTADGVTITYDANGKYDYLKAGESAFDTFDYTFQLGNGAKSTATVTMKIAGVNDVAAISGTAAGAVTEDGTTTASGVLKADDVDTGEAHFKAPDAAALHGTYGDFTFTDGSWSYTLRNSDANVQALTANQQVHDQLSVTSQDGTASQVIDVAVTGTNESTPQLFRVEQGISYAATTGSDYFVFDYNNLGPLSQPPRGVISGFDASHDKIVYDHTTASASDAVFATYGETHYADGSANGPNGFNFYEIGDHWDGHDGLVYASHNVNGIITVTSANVEGLPDVHTALANNVIFTAGDFQI